MVEPENIVLESGREIKINPLTWRQRAEIKDLSLKHFRDNIPISLLVCGRCVQCATGLRDTDLDEWPDDDIYEAGAKIFAQMHLSEQTKKKL